MAVACTWAATPTGGWPSTTWTATAPWTWRCRSDRRTPEAARALPGALSESLASELPYPDDGSMTINRPEGWGGPRPRGLHPHRGVAGDDLEAPNR